MHSTPCTYPKHHIADLHDEFLHLKSTLISILLYVLCNYKREPVPLWTAQGMNELDAARVRKKPFE